MDLEILHHVDGDDVTNGDLIRYGFADASKKGLVFEYHTRICEDDYHVEFVETIWSRNPRRSIRDQRDSPLDENVLVKLAGHDLPRLQAQFAWAMIHLDSRGPKEKA